MVICGLIIVAPWLLGWFAAECFVQASALSHGVLGILMNRTRIVHELGIVGIVGALSVGVDRVVRPAVAALSASRAL